MRSEILIVQRLRAGSLFKILFIGNAVFFISFCTLMGILGLFGIETMKWNNHPLFGVAGLVASPFIGVFLTLFISTFLWVSTFIGLFVYSKFKFIELEYFPANNIETTSTL